MVSVKIPSRIPDSPAVAVERPQIPRIPQKNLCRFQIPPSSRKAQTGHHAVKARAPHFFSRDPVDPPGKRGERFSARMRARKSRSFRGFLRVSIPELTFRCHNSGWNTCIHYDAEDIFLRGKRVIRLRRCKRHLDDRSDTSELRHLLLLPVRTFRRTRKENRIPRRRGIHASRDIISSIRVSV